MSDARCSGIAGAPVADTSLRGLDITWGVTSLLLGLFGMLSNSYILFVIGRQQTKMVRAI